MTKFHWVKENNAKCFPQKWNYSQEEMSTKFWKDKIIFTQVLSEEEEVLSLSELAIKYPCPIGE